MKRIRSFDSLRGYCALWVVLVHVAKVLGLKEVIDLGPLYNGGTPVSIFFILSGFVITGLVEYRKETYPVFIFRRYFRLAPVFIFLCVLYLSQTDMILSTLNALDVSKNEISHRIEIFESSRDYWGGHLLLHATMLHGLFNNICEWSTRAFIPPGWSITVEWQFYIVAPFLIAAFRGQRTLFVTISIIAVTYLNDKVLPPIDLMRHLDSFIVGIGSYFLFSKNDFNFEQKQTCMLLFASIVVAFFAWNEAFIIWGLFLYFTYFQKNLVINKIFMFFFESSPSLFLGRISYSIYLSHMVFIYFILSLSLEYIGSFSAVNFFLINLLAVIVITIICSTILYYTIEKPLMKWSSNLVRKKI